MERIVLYGHNGSNNHGCEAIVRGTHKIIKGENIDFNVLSFNADSDIEFKLNTICNIDNVKLNNIKKNSKEYIISAIKYKVLGNKLAFEKYRNKQFKEKFNKVDIAVSIGGDNYCYDKPRWLFYLNKMAKEKGCKTVLWGCSIEPKSMDLETINDLKRYDLITARESITYNALLKNGVCKNTKLYPDPAFQLEKVDIENPDGFIEGNTIGINLSPLIMECEKENGITFTNFEKLINYILANSDSNVALIPHVSNDIEPLTKLYNKFSNTGRVILIGNKYNAMEIKGVISRCRMFIGARTHATIAAYSTCVPTLVVGYSVKALGIARDIFGSEKNMVISVQDLVSSDDLINAFKYLVENENRLKAHLSEFIPKYKYKALEARKEIEALL